jgi:hypothetical protein
VPAAASRTSVTVLSSPERTARHSGAKPLYSKVSAEVAVRRAWTLSGEANGPQAEEPAWAQYVTLSTSALPRQVLVRRSLPAGPPP